MKEKLLYILWLCLYILCVGLGTVESASGAGKVLLILTAVLFFVPGGVLLYIAVKEKKGKMLLRLRIVSLVSLSLTTVMIIANIFGARASESAGKLLHDLLALVSAPMLCGQNWGMSLFLWAGLFTATLSLRKGVNNP